MSTSTLKKLMIEHLRGSVTPFTLLFEKGKKLTVVYGENGAGKSTICDAFEFLSKGKVGSLENRGLGKTNRYWQSLGKKPADVSVTLETATSTCRATIGKSDVVVAPSDARPRVEVLRRKQILDLIEAEPGKRYGQISRFIDVCGQSTRPQAYFSDSHLDTLGLCVFLALSGLDEAENTSLVLDDVLASVDEPHVERLIEMLYSEAIKFRHCIITTHYRPWKQKLRWGWLKNGQCQFVELAKWTAMNGLTLIRSIPDVERLRQLLAESPPDPQLVCSKAGVILEAALDFLTQLYECAVPRRPNSLYTLGDLLPALDKKLRQSLRVEVLFRPDASGAPTYQTISLTPILDELTRIAQARNVFGAHFSTLSFEMLGIDAIAFGQQVLFLIEALTDPDAGWPRNSRSGSYWATAGDTRRLHPLQKPA